MAFYRKKKKYNSRKRRYMKKYKSKRGKGDRIRYFKLRAVATISADAGGIVKGFLSDDPSGAQDWSSIAALFDAYRVSAIKMKYVPHLPNDTSSVTGFFPLYVVADKMQSGGTNPLSSVNVAVQYENLKVVNMWRPWSYYSVCSKINSVAGASAVDVRGGFLATSGPTETSCIAYYGTGFDASTDYGTLVYTFYLKARSRK